MNYIENSLINFDGNIYLTVGSWMKIITGLNNVTFRNVTVKPSGFDKMYMDKDLIQDKLYE